MKLPPKNRVRSRTGAPQKRGGSRRQTEAKKLVCRIQPICWLRLPGCTIRSTSLDHFYPVSTHPLLEWEPRNHRGACLHCNVARGATQPQMIEKLRAKMLASGKYTPQRPSKALGFFS